MFPITFSESILKMLPNHYMGRWRIVVEGIVMFNNTEIHECAIGYGDVFIE